MNVGSQLYQYDTNKINLRFLKKVLFTFANANFVLILTAFLLGRTTFLNGTMSLGIIFFYASYHYVSNRRVVVSCILAGVISSGNANIYITILEMLIFIVFTCSISKFSSNKVFPNSISIFASIFIPQILIGGFKNLFFYDLLNMLLYIIVVFTLNHVFENIIAIISGKHNKYALSKQQIIGLATLVCLIASGLGNLTILGLNLRDCLITLIILLFGYSGGPTLGATVGVISQSIIFLTSNNTHFFNGTSAFCGMLSGCLNGLGKVGSSLGFIAGNTIYTLYFDKLSNSFDLYRELLLSVVIFLAIPSSILHRTSKILQNDMVFIPPNYDTRFRKLVIQRLTKFSNVFKELAQTFGSATSVQKISNDKLSISTITDKVSMRVCKTCTSYEKCWSKYNMHQIILNMVNDMEVGGKIASCHMPSCCESLSEFIYSVIDIYEILKLDMAWKNKMIGNTFVISQQLNTFSQTITNLIQDVESNVKFNSKLESRILYQLEKACIKSSKVEVLKNKYQRYEITIFHKCCHDTCLCTNVIQSLVSKITNKNMVKENKHCKIDFDTGMCILKLVEEHLFNIALGISRLVKNRQSISGDSYTFMHNGDGKYILALSDGMGSGTKAASQSQATINLLEKFVESELDKDASIQLINSALILKSSNNDSFATIDLSLIDLYSGEVEFVKIGAVPTFIKTPHLVETIKSISLPVGILDNIDMELVHKQVKSGDFLIMMTDGITDCFKSPSNCSETLVNFISQIKSQNPQEIADAISHKANKICDFTPSDDMTVLVAGIHLKTYQQPNNELILNN